MKRIWIDAGKCDGCLNRTLACIMPTGQIKAAYMIWI